MRMWQCVLWLLLAVPSTTFAQQSLTADEIMARVAANQDKEVELRSHYVYRQHTHTTSHKTNGKLMREETDDYDVFPAPQGIDRKLVAVSGRYWNKGKYETFDREPIPDEGSLDAGLTHDIMHDPEEHRHGGVGEHLFPLTSGSQKQYRFHLIGEEKLKGRQVYHVGFEPRNKNEIDWSGEAFIDKEEFQPVNVFTKLSRKLPFFVRGVLGVDLPGIGFSVQYVRLEQGVWFPETFGTEFDIHILHFYSRTMTLSLKNSDFRKTHVETKITVPDSEDGSTNVPR